MAAEKAGGGWQGSLWARTATHPAAKGGEFYGPRHFRFGRAARSPVLRPGSAEAIETLWKVSEAETGAALTV
jgi:hypothetical protein